MTRTITHLSDITEALRELRERRAAGEEQADIAFHLGIAAEELARIERDYAGMTAAQLERVLRLEEELERLRDEVARLEESDERGHD